MNNVNIGKKGFWRFVNKKIRRSIHHYHVLSVINILFEEMLMDLKKGKEIEVHNFGTLSLQSTKPRVYHDVRLRKLMQSKGNKILRFVLSRPIAKKLRSLLDIDRTLLGDHDE